jgi:hypothetical protein
MVMNLRIVLALAVIGCGEVDKAGPDAAGSNTPPPDAAPDAPPPAPRCDPTKDFAAPTLVRNVNTSNDERSFSLTRDERTAFVSSATQVAVATRAATSDPFGVPAQADVAALNAVPGNEYGPSVDADGLALYFGRDLTSADHRIYVATRAAAQTPLSAGSEVSIDGVGAGSSAFAPALSADGKTLYWVEGNTALVHAGTRVSAADLTAPRTVSTAFTFVTPVLSSNELQMFYMPSNNSHVFVSTRASKLDSFAPGVPIASVNSPGTDTPVFLTPDGCVLYLASDRPGGVGGLDIWEAHRPR